MKRQAILASSLLFFFTAVHAEVWEGLHEGTETPDSFALGSAITVDQDEWSFEERDYLYASVGETSSSRAAVGDGDSIIYRAFDGNEHTLRQFNGLYTAVLISESDLGRLTPELVRDFVDRYDILYAHFKELTGSDPPGEGLLRIAFVPTCGGGCGRVGAKGIEITPGYLNLERWPNAHYRVLTHEMTHNFDRWSAFTMLGSTRGHAWTNFLMHYVTYYDQSGTLDTAGNAWPADLNAQDWLQYNIDHLFSGYLNLPDASWERCIRDDDCDPRRITARETQGALLLRMAQLHGPGLVKRWLRHLPELIESKQLSSASMSAEDKADFLMESLSNAAESDLTCHFDSLDWPVSEDLRAQLASSYEPSPYCQDQDQDEYSIFWGDCDDTNALRNPAAAEVPNGMDDNCNRIVDDLQVTELGDFPSSRGTALRLSLPARVSGEIPFDEGDYFRIELAAESTLRFTLQSEGGFQGWLFVFRQDFGGWEGGVRYSGGNRPGVRTLSLGPGTWTFLVGFSSSPGPYEVTIQEASTPSHFTVAAPSQLQADRYQLEAPETPDSVSSPAGLTSRFWVSGVGWVGSAAVSDSQASLNWSVPAQLDAKDLSYRVQFVASEQPVSYRSLPIHLQPIEKFLAQFGNGGGVSSTVILVNPSSLQKASGEVRLFDAAGQPLVVDINGTLRDGAFPFEVPPRGVSFFSSDGLGDLATGSVSVLSYQPIQGTSLFSGSFGVAGMSANPPLARFLVPIGAGLSAESQTGLALSNPTGSEVQAVLRLREDGAPVPDAEAVVSLAPHGQFSGFPQQLFQGGIDFSHFRGTLEVDAPVPINGMAILVTAGEFATLPVASVLAEPPLGEPDPRELHFAQIGNGAGISSTLVLMNPSAVDSVTGRVHLV